MKSLTKKQRDILDYIKEHIEAEAIAPSYREIMKQFNFASPGSVYKHILALKKKGALLSEKKVARSLYLENNHAPTMPKTTVEIPLVGVIRAGYPIETFQHTELISVPSSYILKPDQSYILRVQGEAMKEEQIADGDLLIIEARPTASPGEMTLVLINSHDTFLKKFYPDGIYVRLEALDPNVKPMILRRENLEVQGVLIGLLRLYSH